MDIFVLQSIDSYRLLGLRWSSLTQIRLLYTPITLLKLGFESTVGLTVLWSLVDVGDWYYLFPLLTPLYPKGCTLRSGSDDLKSVSPVPRTLVRQLSFFSFLLSFPSTFLPFSHFWGHFLSRSSTPPLRGSVRKRVKKTYRDVSHPFCPVLRGRGYLRGSSVVFVF